MTVETGVYSLLSGSSELAALLAVTPDVLAGLVMRSGSVIDPPDRFIVVRWEETPAPTAWLSTRGLTIRVHDRNQTYSFIDDALDICKRILTAVVHQQGITQVDWRGRSPDLYDDGYRTATRYDTYVVAGGINAGRK